MKLSKEFIAMFREEAKKAQWEVNSWNGKSIDDLVVDYLERKELKPEDFTGAVILTAEEAKVLHSIVMDSKHDHCITQEDADVFSVFTKRIEQAEKGNETNSES